MKRPNDILETGEYQEPNTFENDQESILFHSYIEVWNYARYLEKERKAYVEQVLDKLADLVNEYPFERIEKNIEEIKREL